MGLSASLVALLACAPRIYTDGDTGSSWTAPENTWESSEPPRDLQGEGFEEGEVVPDVRGVDQHGDEVSLWQFYGKLIVFDVSTQWCAPCQELARGTEETYQLYRDRGVVYVTLMGEDIVGQPATQETTLEWADAFGITAPVITDPAEVRHEVVADNLYPRVMIIGRDLTIEIDRIDSPSDPAIRAALEGLL